MSTKDLERLLAEQVDEDGRRAEREKAIAALTVERAVLFTDIVGSTEFFEKHGDVAGMTLLQRHDALLHPLVAANRGRIVKTIGDAIMAVFDDSLDGVRCGVAMQAALTTERQRRTDEPIHVRIGVHAGKVFQKGDDVFGDTVNTAARINHEARSDEVLLSKSLYEKIPASEGLRGIPRGSAPLKGKAEPVPLVGLALGATDAATLMQPEVGLEYTPAPASNPELFVLELQLGARGLKVSAIDGAGDKGTVKAYEELPVTPADLSAAAAGFEPFMTGNASSYRDRIRERGEGLFASGLSERARRHLTQTSLHFLRLHLDDELVHVPWELMHDGKQFLGLRFAIGRNVSARGDSAPQVPSRPGRGHALVISNATGDLAAAKVEGTAVAGLLRDGYAGEVRHLEGPVTRAAFFKALAGCEVLHFAGHSQAAQGAVRGGFQLADGIATPDEVVHACGAAAPSLVFANSCGSATSAGWTEASTRNFSLASALLMRGSQHYIGPMWDIPDEDALAFALRFYEKALSGVPFGEAVRAARVSLFSSGRQPLSFAGYVLYGPPRTAFHASSVKLRDVSEKMRSSHADAIPVGVVPGAAASGGAHPVDALHKAITDARSSTGLLKWGRWFLVAGTVAGLAGKAAMGIVDFVHASKAVLPVVVATATPGTTVAAAATPATTVVAMLGSAGRHEGPVRVAVLPFKNLSDDAAFNAGEGMQESVITALGGDSGVSSIDAAQGTAGGGAKYGFDETWARKWILDGKEVPAFNRDALAALGKYEGAEVIVVGAYQKSGTSIRANARFVDAETGQVLQTVKVDRGDGDVFKLEDALGDATKRLIPTMKTKMRPGKTP